MRKWWSPQSHHPWAINHSCHKRRKMCNLTTKPSLKTRWSRDQRFKINIHYRQKRKRSSICLLRLRQLWSFQRPSQVHRSQRAKLPPQCLEVISRQIGLSSPKKCLCSRKVMERAVTRKRLKLPLQSSWGHSIKNWSKFKSKLKTWLIHSRGSRQISRDCGIKSQYPFANSPWSSYWKIIRFRFD